MENIFKKGINENFLREFEKDLARIIKIPSVSLSGECEYPYGRECAEVLDLMLDISKNYGFKTENHEYRCGSVIYGDCEDEVGILVHLDVVPASGENWTGDPFTLRRQNNLLIGRGTIDDKGPAMLGLYAMRFLKENNIELPFAVRLILGCDEETNSSDVKYFAEIRKPPMFSFTPDHKYPVCIGEKDIITFDVNFGYIGNMIHDLSAGTVTNAVPDRACIIIDKPSIALPKADKITIEEEISRLIITATGRSAHSSTPEIGINAISILSDYLIKNGLIPFEAENAAYFIASSSSSNNGEIFGINGADPHMGLLTCIASVAKIENGYLKVNYNVRSPDILSIDEVYKRSEAAVLSRGFQLTRKKSSKGYFKSPESDAIRALTQAAETVLERKCVPYTMGGGTYARALPNTVAYGAEIEEYRGLLGEGRGNPHDPDEYIALEEVAKGIEIFARALIELGKIYDEKGAFGNLE